MADQVVRIARRPAIGMGVLWVVVAFTAAMPPGAAVAQDGPRSDIRVSFTADRASLTVGDLVTLTLEVTHPAGHVVAVPRLGPEWGSFEVVSQSPTQTDSNSGGAETTRQRIEVTLFAPGTFETPELPISVHGPDGGVERVFPSPVQLTVDSVLSSSDETLRDIRLPADLSPPLWKQPAALAVAALTVLVVLVPVAYFIYRRRSRGDFRPGPTVDARTPWETALQEIDRTERLGLPGDGRFKEHYTLVSGVVKAYVRAMYLENAGRSDAAEMTTEEIEAAIEQSSLDRGNARLVTDLLFEADLVRFSSYVPSESRAYEALRLARDIVEGTRRASEEAARREGAQSQTEATA